MRKFNKKTLSLVVSIVLLLAIGVGGTLAYLLDATDPIKNIFTPSEVNTYVEEKIDGGVKSDVRIENTGNTDAYIRAALVFTWQDEYGNVYGTAPVEGVDYELILSNDNNDALDGTNMEGKWVKNGDFYYWTKPVAPNAFTGRLINSCKPAEGKAPEGYNLCVEIICSGIQSVGTDGTNSAVKDAWGLDPSNL